VSGNILLPESGTMAGKIGNRKSMLGSDPDLMSIYWLQGSCQDFTDLFMQESDNRPKQGLAFRL
jgi:hypothetical protein